MSNTKNVGKGNYYSPLPLDFVILDTLPEKGMIGGVHWKGRRVVDIRDEIVDGNAELRELVKSSTISARIRSMNLEGYVESFPSIGSSGVRIWARTEKGTEYLATRDQVLGA